MKRVISALAVIAIVSGALAFKAPLSGSYCGSTTAANTNCKIIPLKKEVVGTPNTFIKSDFDGVNCPATDCPTAIRLVAEN
jgi:hypothetical protein